MSENLRGAVCSAVYNGDVETLRNLIIRMNGLENFPEDVSSSELLVLAIQRRRNDVVKLLLEYNAEVNNSFDDCTAAALHVAVHNDDEEIVKMLLDRAANANAKDRFGKTPLHVAAVSGNVRISEYLLNHGANVDSLSGLTSFRRYTPLYFAVERNHLDLVKLLLSRGADVNAGDQNGPRPIAIAAELGYEEIVKILLKNGANVDTRHEDGSTILNLAVRRGRASIVELILKSRPDVEDRSNKRSLNAAILKGKENDIVEMLLRYNLTVDREEPDYNELLYAAAAKGYSTVVEDVLNRGADVDAATKSACAKDFTPLHSAAKNQRIEVARLLIDRGANINARDSKLNTPVVYAIESDNATITEMLLNRGATVNNLLLNTAVMEANRRIVEMLLQKNVSIHTRTSNFHTTLHYTGFTGGICSKYSEMDDEAKDRYKSDKAEIAKLLLQLGANVDAIDGEGMTVLYAAATSDNDRLVEILLKHNARVNTKTRKLSTPLHASVRNDNETIVRMLLKSGADVNAVEEDGKTALYIASERGHHEIVETLLRHGAEVYDTFERKLPNERPQRMKNPLYIAAKKDYRVIVELMLQYGVDIDFSSLGDPTALQAASFYGNIDTFRLLIAYGADINANGLSVGGSPLESAISGIHEFLRKDFPRARQCKDIADRLRELVVKSTVAHLFVNERNFRLVDFRCEYKDLAHRCMKEIEDMKNEQIGNSNVTFYDVLTVDTKQVAMYARNENIDDALASCDEEKKFPEYFKMMRDNFDRGQRRNNLLRLSSESIAFLSGYELPEIVTNVILRYLGNADLMFLVEAYINSSHRC